VPVIDDLGPDVGFVDREHTGVVMERVVFFRAERTCLDGQLLLHIVIQGDEAGLAACEFERQMEGPIEVIVSVGQIGLEQGQLLFGPFEAGSKFGFDGAVASRCGFAEDFCCRVRTLHVEVLSCLAAERGRLANLWGGGVV